MTQLESWQDHLSSLGKPCKEVPGSGGTLRYTRWVFRAYTQRPTIGSKWYYGNFSLGLAVDAHPRFVNIIFSLWFVEFVLSWNRGVFQCANLPDKEIKQ